ncbi:hypothetical protein OHA71_23910 [Streptomyces sp. NBC_00444]|uniref:hypothetical protein n=1 Tax=Streptomyces sp. NBC_00444 TaxID=2975744 RepID=UPI002E1C46B8
MSQYTDGYSPRQVMQSLSLLDDMITPPITINFEVTAEVGNHPQEAAEALEAGTAAIKAALEAAFPGLPVSVNGAGITGSKALP